MKKLKRKLILMGVAIVFTMVAITGVTYAYWDSLQTNDNTTLTLGEGDTLTVTLNSADTGILIPTTITPTGDEVNELVYTYDVVINEEAMESGNVNLTVTYDNLLIGGVDTYNHLINIVIATSSKNLSTTSSTVTITVTMNEPNDVNEYNAIINQDVTFNVTFTVGV